MAGRTIEGQTYAIPDLPAPGTLGRAEGKMTGDEPIQLSVFLVPLMICPILTFYSSSILVVKDMSNSRLCFIYFSS